MTYSKWKFSSNTQGTSVATLLLAMQAPSIETRQEMGFPILAPPLANLQSRMESKRERICCTSRKCPWCSRSAAVHCCSSRSQSCRKGRRSHRGKPITSGGKPIRGLETDQRGKLLSGVEIDAAKLQRKAWYTVHIMSSVDIK